MKRFVLAFLLCLGLLGAVEGHRRLAVMTTPPAIPADPQRIVSLAPSVTETLYAIGLGDRVVGVTKYCRFPPAAREKPVVAGFSDVNYEAVIRQRPDLVALPKDKIRNRKNLERLGLAVLPLDTRSLHGLLEVIDSLGRATGRRAEVKSIIDRVQAAILEARSRAAGKSRPRVLFSVMHSYTSLGYITEINAVGRDGFFSEMLEIAGGQNVYQGALSFPRLSREAIIFLNPEVIIDVIPYTEDLESVRQDWYSLTAVEAVKNDRVVFLTDEADIVPGPRMDQTLAKISRALYPPETTASKGGL